MVPKIEGGVRGVTGRAGFLPVLLQATSDRSDRSTADRVESSVKTLKLYLVPKDGIFFRN